MYHSLNAGHLQLDASVRLNTLVIRCFLTSPTTVSKLLSPFYKKRGHKKRFFSHHHKFRAPTTSKTKVEARHHPSVLKVNFHHRLNVIYGCKFYATVEFQPKTLTRYDTIWYLDVNGLNSESFNYKDLLCNSSNFSRFIKYNECILSISLSQSIATFTHFGWGTLNKEKQAR